MTSFEDTLDRFRAAAEGAPESVPLARLALLVAQVEYPELDVLAYERRLVALSQSLEVRIHPAADTRTQLAELHKLVFDECAFRGNELEYNDPRNLYLNDVIDRQTGIPATLAIIYVAVAQRAGIRALPVGLPGRVVVRIESADGPILIDPFERGRELTEEECQTIVRNVYGRRNRWREHFLDPITPRQLIQRLIHNLKATYLQRGDEERAGRMIELLLAMYPWDLDEIRDRGMLRERIGAYAEALDDLEHYVQYRIGARDIQTVTEAVRSLRRQTGTER
jgi:regulator of sirC expression with transglutaminase-like and TPR domain